LAVQHPSAASRVKPDHAGLHAATRELIQYHELLYLVTLREIKVRYKQTLLGACWAVLQPLSLMLVLTVFLSVFAQAGNDAIPYPLFSYIGLLPWTFFATAVSFAVMSLIGSPHLIKNVYFPREILPIAAVLVALLDFAVASVALVVMLASYQVTINWSALYVIPLLFIQITFTTSVCLLLSAVTAIYRDIRFTVPLALQLGMFVTPILYPVSVVPEAVRVPYMLVNPMAVVVDGYRRALVGGQAPDLLSLATALLGSAGVLCFAYTYFKRLERSFADVI
jgi:lipopolysaccharide transport system permease protein